MSAALSERQAWLSRLEEELATARKFEAASKEHLAAQEERVAQLKAKKIHRRDSERLLVLLRESNKLQQNHVRLLEREIRELSTSLGAVEDTD